MAKTVDVRAYLLLERAFVRRLQRSWKLQSAPIYAKITQACLDHQWDRARLYVTDLDMTEVGTHNREWITYMLLSCAVFGAGQVAKNKPSFVGVGTFDTFLKQVTTNIIQYLEHKATPQIQAEALQSIAEDEAKTKALPKVAWDEAKHPRDKEGQFAESAERPALTQRFLERAQGQHKRPHEDYQPVRVTTNPHQTRFLLPDGTRIRPAHPGMEHSDAAFEALTYEGHTEHHALEDLMKQGVIRYNKGMGGIQVIGTMTEAQANLIADDWNIIYNDPLYANSVQMKDGKPDWDGSKTQIFTPPFTADKLRYWINHPEVQKWEEAEHPRDKEGKFVLSQGDRSALDTFGFPGAAWSINRAFRTGRRDAAHERIIGVLDRLMRPEPAAVVHRAVDAKLVKDLKVGDVFTDQGYTSTVSTAEDVIQFAEHGSRYYGDEERAKIQIHLPEGALRINTDRYAEGPYAMGPAAGEVILPRGSTFRVKSTNPLVLEMVPHTQKWEESQHPRDAEGQFTAAGGGMRAKALYPVEGGFGPARAHWEKSNQEAMDAFDAFMDAKAAHRVLADKAVKEADRLTDLGQDTGPIWQNPEYLESKARLLRAERIHKEADDALAAAEPAMKKEVVQNLATDVAEKLNIDPVNIHVVYKEPPQFMVGGKKFTEAGHYDPADSQIELNAKNLNYADAVAVKGVTAHEISHYIYHALKAEADAEFERYLKKSTTPDGQQHTNWYKERFTEVGFKRFVKPEYQAEMAKEFPASMVLSTLSNGNIFSGISIEMVNENGHSAYAKSYWTAESRAQHGHTYETAINETLAEVTRWITYPGSWHEAGVNHTVEGGKIRLHPPTTAPKPNSPWVKLTKDMHQWYAETHA